MALTEEQIREFGSSICNHRAEEAFGGNSPCYALRLAKELKINDKKFLKLIKNMSKATNEYYDFYYENGFDEYHW